MCPSPAAASPRYASCVGLSACPCSERVLCGAGVTVQVLANPISAPVQFERLLADFRDSLRAEPNCFGKCQDLVFWSPNETGSNVAYAAHVVLLLMAILGDKRVPLVGDQRVSIAPVGSADLLARLDHLCAVYEADRGRQPLQVTRRPHPWLCAHDDSRFRLRRTGDPRVRCPSKLAILVTLRVLTEKPDILLVVLRVKCQLGLNQLASVEVSFPDDDGAHAIDDLCQVSNNKNDSMGPEPVAPVCLPVENELRSRHQ